MGVWRWPSVSLKGDSHQIPRICPNCMAPATVEYRYCYVGPFYFISRTRYWQTFYYCGACEPMLDTYFKIEKFTGCFGMLLYPAAFIGGIIGAIALMDATGLEEAVGKDVSVWIAIAAGIGFGFGGYWLLRGLRTLFMKKHPLQAGQALQEPAAYYTGQAFAGFGLSHVYHAVRPEWLKALVEANAESVSDKEYQRIVGAAKPAAGPEKPFAG